MKVALILCALLVATACGGETQLTPTPAEPSVTASPARASVTPAPVASATRSVTSPSPVPSKAAGSRCPVTQDLCDFATATEALLKLGDADAVVGAAPGRAVTCTTGTDPGLGADFPLCAGAVAGEVRYGFHFGRFQSEGVTVSHAGLVAVMGDWLGSADVAQTDGDGDGAIRLGAIGCPTVDASSVDCAMGFNLMLTAIERHGNREFLLIRFTSDERGSVEVAGMYTGILKLNEGYFADSGTSARLDPSDRMSPQVRYLQFDR